MNKFVFLLFFSGFGNWINNITNYYDSWVMPIVIGTVIVSINF